MSFNKLNEGCFPVETPLPAQRYTLLEECSLIQKPSIMSLYVYTYVCTSVCSVTSVVSDSATSWTSVCQALLSMGFSWQEYWSGLPCPLPGDLPNPGVKSGYPALQAASLPSEPQGNMYTHVRVMINLHSPL